MRRVYLGYHSSQWGFDSDFSLKRYKSQKMLESLQVNFVKTSCVHGDEICHYVLDSNYKYLVFVCFPRNGQFAIHNFSFYDISSMSQVLSHCAFSDFSSLEGINFFITPQLEYKTNDLMARLVSDGTGSLFGEIITIGNTTRSFEQANSSELDYFEFMDYELMDCSNYRIRLLFDSEINICIFKRGYFEVAKARLFDSKDTYFMYYSDLPEYRNVFNNRSKIPNISIRAIEAWQKN